MYINIVHDNWGAAHRAQSKMTINNITDKSSAERIKATANNLVTYLAHDCKRETTVDPNVGLPLGKS